MRIPNDETDNEDCGRLLAASHEIAGKAEAVKRAYSTESPGYDQAVADIRLERLKLALCQTQTSTDAVVLLHATLEVADAIRCQALADTLLPNNVALLATEMLNAIYSVVAFHERQIGATTNDLGLAPVAPVELMRLRNSQKGGSSYGLV